MKGLVTIGDGQRIEFFGQRRDHGRRARAGAAAEARGDEDQIRAFEHAENALGVFERGLRGRSPGSDPAPRPWVIFAPI